MEKYKLRSRVEKMTANKVNAFSPTISPAPKDSDSNEIESVRGAIEYYYEKGVREFVAQKKYMGSYCDIYLCAALEESYIVSRNGYVITHVDRDAVLKGLEDLHGRFDWSVYEMMLIQSELMPWSTMGKGLIDNDFFGYIDAHTTHHDYLKESGLYAKLEKVKSSDAYEEFETEYEPKAIKSLSKKYPKYVIRQYKAVHDIKVLDLENYSENIDRYKTQIEHYGAEGELSFKPFNILKRMRKDGNEEFVNDNLSYHEINEDEMLHFDINNQEDKETRIVAINKWLSALTEDMEEGIMIKPRLAFVPGLPPAFKIRNNDYLTMIYGIGFIPEYDRYIKKRRISKKVDCSINDWMQNWELLKIPHSNINSENYHYKNLMCDRILGEIEGNQLDARL